MQQLLNRRLFAPDEHGAARPTHVDESGERDPGDSQRERGPWTRTSAPAVTRAWRLEAAAGRHAHRA